MAIYFIAFTFSCNDDDPNVDVCYNLKTPHIQLEFFVIHRLPEMHSQHGYNKFE